jgi:hypothetical protein
MASDLWLVGSRNNACFSLISDFTRPWASRVELYLLHASHTRYFTSSNASGASVDRESPRTGWGMRNVIVTFQTVSCLHFWQRKMQAVFRGPRGASALALRPFTTTSSASRHGLILGCGSNVMDLFFNVRSLPGPGEKQYFAGTNVLSASVVGGLFPIVHVLCWEPRRVQSMNRARCVVAGVTLNHLAWAAALGARTGLLALQGDDEYGKQIRATMDDLGVSRQFVQHGPQFNTSVSHVFLDEYVVEAQNARAASGFT